MRCHQNCWYSNFAAVNSKHCLPPGRAVIIYADYGRKETDSKNRLPKVVTAKVPNILIKNRNRLQNLIKYPYFYFTSEYYQTFGY